jgi:hypothetical protein
MTSKRNPWFVAVLVVIAIGLIALLLAPLRHVLRCGGAGDGVDRHSEVAHPRCGWTRQPCGTLITLATLLVILLPLGALSAMLLREAEPAAQWVEQTVNEQGIDGLIEPLPAPLPRLARLDPQAVPQSHLPRPQIGAAHGREPHPEREEGEAVASSRDGGANQGAATVWPNLVRRRVRPATFWLP